MSGQIKVDDLFHKLQSQLLSLRTEPDVTGTVSWEVTNGFAEKKKSTTENDGETKQTSWQGKGGWELLAWL